MLDSSRKWRTAKQIKKWPQTDLPELRPIEGWPTYHVSADGRAFRLLTTGVFRPLKPTLNNNGYESISISAPGRRIHVLIHRSVAIAFIGPPPSDKHEARHIDGNNRNNVATNLAWGTHAENMQDMVRHGNQGAYRHPERVARGDRHSSKTKPWAVPRGERSGAATITEEQVRAIRATFEETKNISATARLLGVSRDAAKHVLNGKTWKHVA